MEEDFFSELKSLVSNMLDNLRPRYVPLSRTTLQLLFPLAVSAGVLIIVILIVANIISYIRRKGRRRERLGQFDRMLAEVEAVLGCAGGEGGRSGNLVRRCLELGELIDWHTNRPDNARLVAMLAYHIAKSTKMSGEQAAICFCCALVADAGMLELPRQLFFRELLSAKERMHLRDQCRAFIYQLDSHLDCIPAGYMRFFTEAGLSRKENMDGSGYPEGLGGKQIPVLARIIRVAEDFTSMTERRSRKFLIPLSRRAALKEMRRSAELYDGRILDIMEKIVLPPA